MSSPVPPGMPPQGQPPQYPPQYPQQPPYQQQGQYPQQPQYPQQQLPPGKKANVLVWILGGIAVLLFGGMLTCGAIGYFVMHKVKQAGFDSDLMKSNPGLAMAKMAAAMSPNAEVVSTNDRAGTVTIRDKSTGKIVTMKFDPDKKTMVVVGEDGKEVSVKITGDGSNSGGIEMQSSEGTMKFGASAGNSAPAWVPVYPGSSPQGTFSSQTPEGDQHGFSFKTSDAATKVISYYQDQLKSAGFTVNLATTGDQGGMVSAEDSGKKRNIVVTVGTSGEGTQVGVMALEKK